MPRHSAGASCAKAVRYCEDRGSERRGEQRTGELRGQWASGQDTGDLKTVRYCTDRRDSVIEAEELRERKAPNSKKRTRKNSLKSQQNIPVRISSLLSCSFLPLLFVCSCFLAASAHGLSLSAITCRAYRYTSGTDTAAGQACLHPFAAQSLLRDTKGWSIAILQNPRDHNSAVSHLTKVCCGCHHFALTGLLPPLQNDRSATPVRKYRLLTLQSIAALSGLALDAAETGVD